MRVLISGSSGLIGSAVGSALNGEGHEVVPLVRSRPVSGRPGVFWDVDAGKINAGDVSGMDAVIHLAGENIGEGFWSPEKKRRIRESRVVGTRTLAEAIAAAEDPPETMLCASAVGYYGSRGSVELTEDDGRGSGFLAEVAEEWEAACDPAREVGVRVVNLRFGVVLSPEDGALRRMLAVFRLGLGGVLSGGSQYMSWVTLPDLVAAAQFALGNKEIRGPVNMCSPNPVTNREFTRALAHVLHRPALFTVPAFALRIGFGGAADEMLLASTRAVPARLLSHGFTFGAPGIEGALRSAITDA